MHRTGSPTTYFAKSTDYINLIILNVSDFINITTFISVPHNQLARMDSYVDYFATVMPLNLIDDQKMFSLVFQIQARMSESLSIFQGSGFLESLIFHSHPCF